MKARASADGDADTDKLSIRAIVDCLEHLAADAPITAKQMIVALYGGGHDRQDGSVPVDHHQSYQGAREALEMGTLTKVGQTPATTKVGLMLHKHIGRVVGGKKIVNGPLRSNMKTWTVKIVE